MFAPVRPFGAVMRMPSYDLSTIAPNARSASRWKSIGRSPMRQPPRSGMSASPSACSSGPQNRIGIRLEPASASICAKCARSTFFGSSTRTPSSGLVTATPYASSIFVTIEISEICGTSCRMLGVLPRSAATIAFVARFLAPRTCTVPVSGLPPRMTMPSAFRPTRSAAIAASFASPSFTESSTTREPATVTPAALPPGEPVYRTGRVRGRQLSLVPSNSVIRASSRNVSPMSSSPSSNLQRV